MTRSPFEVTPEMVEKANRKIVEAKKSGQMVGSSVKMFGKDVPVQVRFVCPPRSGR